MCRTLVVLALVLGLASASFADVLIGNFEDDGAGPMSDGWGPAWEGTPAVGSSAEGATLEDLALTVQTTGGYWTLQWTCPVAPLDLADATAITMDVTMIASEWNYEWSKIDKLAIASDGPSDWQEYDVVSSSGDPSWGGWEGDVTKTLTWDLTNNSYNSIGATYLQFNVALQNPNAGFPRCFHIDNVWIIDEYLEGDTTGGGSVLPILDCTPIFIPEPMTIAMLGLGSLALLRKKQ